MYLCRVLAPTVKMYILHRAETVPQGRVQVPPLLYGMNITLAAEMLR